MKTFKLTDATVEAIADFHEGGKAAILCDTDLKGFRVRVGSRAVAWQFYRQFRKPDGAVRTVCVGLGAFPDMPADEARRLATIEAGKLASGRPSKGRREAVTFDAALQDYAVHCEQQT